MAASIGRTFTVLCKGFSSVCVCVVMEREERELPLSACCFKNFSLAPEPPGVLE